MLGETPPTVGLGTTGSVDLRAIYEQLCVSYRAIDEARTKLLGLLPLATGAGILVLGGGIGTGPIEEHALPVGVFGLVATLGLFSYEIHGIKKCAYLIDAGKMIEEGLGVYGQFLSRPRSVAGFIDEPFAASVIYPASLAGWVFFAAPKAPPSMALGFAVGTFACAFILSTLLIRRMETDIGNKVMYRREPLWFRTREAPGAIPRDALLEPRPVRQTPSERPK